jgi:hypothetical protein
MKISEVINEWSSTSIDIRPALEEKGYEFLGKGVDQTAYLAPDGTVLKIFGTQPGALPGQLSADQKMAVYWIKYCQANTQNSCLPRFGGWDTFAWNERNYLQISMERLGPFPSGWAYELKQIADLAGQKGRSGVVRSVKAEVEHWINIMAKKDGSQTDARAEMSMSLGYEGLTQLLSTCREIKSMGAQHGWYFDLHEANWMIRNDGTPVIVDPWVVNS